MIENDLKNRIINFLYKNKNIVFLLLNIIIGITLALLINIYYETNDDWYLSLISQGYFGENTSQYMVYSNVILGYVLRPLYMVFGTINWYVVIQLILLVLSGYSLYCIIKKRSLLFSLLITLLFWLTVLFGTFHSIEFTKSSGIVSITGMFLLYCSCIEKDTKNIILGLMLSIFGFLYRNQSFLLTLPFIFLVIIFDCIIKYRNDDSIIKRIVKVFSLLFLLIVVFFAVDKLHYQTDEWKEYTKFNDGIVEIFDYMKAPYSENKENYSKINYSENDYKIIRECLNDDVLKFNGDDLWDVISQSQNDIKSISIKKFIKFLIEYANYKNTLIFATLLLLLLITFFNKETRLQSIIIAVLELLILFYLYIKGRYPERVLNIVRACHFISYAYLIAQIKCDCFSNRKVNTILITLLVICLCFAIYVNKKAYKGDDVKFTDIIRNYDGKYVVDISYDNVEIQNQENPLFVTDVFAVNNCDYIYSWIAGSPIVINNRTQRGYCISPYMQLIEDGTYLITKTEYHVNIIEKYLKENYDKNINKKYIDSIYCGESIYMIYDFSLR